MFKFRPLAMAIWDHVIAQAPVKKAGKVELHFAIVDREARKAVFATMALRPFFKVDAKSARP